MSFRPPAFTIRSLLAATLVVGLYLWWWKLWASYFALQEIPRLIVVHFLDPYYAFGMVAIGFAAWQTAKFQDTNFVWGWLGFAWLVTAANVEMALMTALQVESTSGSAIPEILEIHLGLVESASLPLALLIPQVAYIVFVRRKLPNLSIGIGLMIVTADVALCALLVSSSYGQI